MKQFKLKSFDNTELFARLWDDVDSPKGVVLLVHGMSEHAGRYDEFARYLNDRGYIVFADDHRAHGRTESDVNRGRHKGNIFRKTLEDELFICDMLKDEYDLPVFVLGHSYGSFISQALAQENTCAKAIALVGSGYMRTLFSMGKIALFPVWLFARNWRPKIVRYASDNMFRYKGDKGKLQWVNSVPERREQVLCDPYCHVAMSVNFSYRMMSETSKLYGKKAQAKLNPATAIGMFSGDADPVGQMGKSVKKLDKFYRANGIKTELHLYKGARHDVFYDWCGKDMQKDVADFFDKFIIYKQTSIDELV